MAGTDSDGRAPVVYRFIVGGHLGQTLLGAFPGLAAENRGGVTFLTGTIRDQAALHGVLAQIEALGLELVEVRRVSANPAE